MRTARFFIHRAALLLLVMITTATARAIDGITYIDENGETKTVASEDYKILEGNLCGGAKLPAGTYIVYSNITYTSTVTLDGDVTLILADGATMTVVTSDNLISRVGIDGGATLKIYGQTNGTGALNVYSTANAIQASDIDIYGGNITANTSGYGAYAINSGNSGITINCKSVTATATGDESTGIFGYGNVDINSGNVTAMGGAFGINAKNGFGIINLGWTNATDRITANSYEGIIEIATDGGKKLYDGNSTFLSGTVSASAIDGKTLQPALSTPYIDADGSTHAATDAIVLSPDQTTLGAHTYVATGTLNYTSGITLSGNVTLILCDGATMSVGTNENRINGDGINCGGTLAIYGQTNGTGALSIYTRDTYASSAIRANNLTINGGNITAYISSLDSYAIYAKDALTINRGTVKATATGRNSKGIYVDEGSVTISGGNVKATGDCYGIWAKNSVTISRGNVKATYSASSSSGDTDGIYTEGAITLGWTDYTDRIFASSYNSEDDDISINGFLTDGNGNTYGGTVDQPDALAGKTLQPCLALANNADNSGLILYNNGTTIAVALLDRVLYKDGNWNTLCLPFAVSTTSGPLSGDGVTAMTLNTSTSNLSGSTLTLNFTAAETIPAGTPFIIKWENTGEDIENPTFTGVTISGSATTEVSFTGGKFIGTYSPIVWKTEDKSILFLGTSTDDNGTPDDDSDDKIVSTLFYPNAAMTINSCRAYFSLSLTSAVKEFRLNFGEDDSADGIENVQCSMFNVQCNDAWYDLSGRRLGGKPKASGIYINNGRKVVNK